MKAQSPESTIEDAHKGAVFRIHYFKDGYEGVVFRIHQ